MHLLKNETAYLLAVTNVHPRLLREKGKRVWWWLTSSWNQPPKKFVL